MSPILLRPIREQVEHDRVIRQLQGRWRRKYEVAINVGADETTPVKAGPQTVFPDLVLTATTSGRRLHGVVEVETAESVNHLEAKAEWLHFAKARGAFYLYVPAGFTDVAERLCRAMGIKVTEIWAYYAIASQVKFSLAYRSPRAQRERRAAAAAAAAANEAAKKKAAKKKAAKKTSGNVAKKAAAKKKVAKKTAKKVAAASARKRTAVKQTARKKATKKTVTKKSVAKKASRTVVKKAVAKKKTAKKTSARAGKSSTRRR